MVDPWIPVVVVGAKYTDDSHPDEPTFTIVSLDPNEPIADLDNGQWYELNGPEGLLAKLAAGIVRRID